MFGDLCEKYVGMNFVQFGRERAKIGQLPSDVRRINKQKYAPESSSQKSFKQFHLPMLEASFLECLCMECKVNYLIFKDLVLFNAFVIWAF